jgi:putative DNA primase/helicase
VNKKPILTPPEAEHIDWLASQFDLCDLGGDNGTANPVKLEYRTETDAARLFATRYGGWIRYCAKQGGWYLWDGRRWKRDDEGATFKLAEELTPLLADAANEIPDVDERLKVLKFAISLRNRRRLENVVAIASWQPGIVIAAPEQFDADPWLFNVQNGTIDLRTGSLRLHNRNDLITKIASIQYESDAICERWRQFLKEIFDGDCEMCEFIRHAIGYSLTGINREHAFFVLYGIGANGKSSLVDTLVHLLGDYATTAAPDTFLDRRSGTPTNDLARLRGARFVSTVETGERQSLAENFVKAITGGDRISARFLYEEFFDFEPVFKLWLASNHKPVIRAADEGIWRRVRLVPFLERFEGERADRNLREKLQAELTGILAWAVRGCLEWQQAGLQPPRSVIDATADYRSEMDTFAGFIADCCVLSADGSVGATELYNAYRLWCTANSERALTQTRFGTQLRDRGLQKARSGRKRRWLGITLSPAEESSDDFGANG